MAEHCTCGAELPPEARFCHKCGKPQFEALRAEEPELRPADVEAPPPVRGPQPAPEINFHNRIAVRAGMLAAALASLLISLPMPVYFGIVWILVLLVSSGFFAVYVYGRRTGLELSVRNGARMGWMTGMFCFAIATVFFTISVILLARQGGLGAFYREQLGARAASEAGVEAVLEVLESPAGLAGIIVFTLIMLFFFFTLLPTLGGALGAKVLEKE